MQHGERASQGLQLVSPLHHEYEHTFAMGNRQEVRRLTR
jgi:hypothetical protein